jgi:hypothetical protein
MRRINVNGVAMAIGLEWLALPARKKVAQAEREMRKSRHAVASIRVTAGDSTMIGMSKLMPTEPLVSVAAWLGHENRKQPGLLFIRELDNNEFWVCGICRGVPVVRGERIVAKRELEESMNEVAALVMTQLPGNPSIHAYADISNNEQMVSQLAANGCEPASLESMLSGSKPPEFAILGGQVKQSPQQMVMGVVIGLSVVGVACAGGWYYYQQEQARKAQEAAARAAELAAQKARLNPDQIYANAIADYVSQNPLPLATEFVRESVALAFNQPVLDNGWKFNSMDCRAATASCELKYQRMPFGGAFPAIVGTQSVTKVINEVDSATVIVAMKSKPVSINKPVALEALLAHFTAAKVNSNALSVLREARDLRLTTALRPTQKIPKLPPSTGSELVEGKWELSGQSIGYELLFNLPDTFTVDTVSVVRGNDVLGLRASGSYLMFQQATQQIQQKKG